ncbi:hypothetical protein [Kitasatospora sp. NPDC047058]|uniref:hypothetical protein n=1 Tax=Kitasatospora sp. NPDC047058 TaxID=3155620 RepID=UPI0033F77775
MPRIAMLGEDGLPDGPHRNLVHDLQRLHRLTGYMSTRAISEKVRESDEEADLVSRETVSSMLSGKKLPAWPKVQSVVRVLVAKSVEQLDAQETLRQVHEAWLRASDEDRHGSDREPVHRGGAGGSGQSAYEERDDAEASQRDGPLTNQPMTLVNGSWPGAEMFEVANLAGRTVLSLNSRHSMVKRFLEARNRAAAARSRSEVEDLVDELADSFDLLLMAWARADGMFEAGSSDDMSTYWGMFAQAFVKAQSEAKANHGDDA